LSTLREVDDIVVFDGGRVVEFGERDTLAGDPSSTFHRLLALALEDDEHTGAADRELLR
jgi:ABC-type multidrug transport system fused ATPase/permease subunit